MATKAKKTASNVSDRKSAAAPKAAAPAKAQASSQPKLVVSQQELEQRIRDRAYYIYLKRGCSQDASAEQDWLDAEKQVKKELGLR